MATLSCSIIQMSTNTRRCGDYGTVYGNRRGLVHFFLKYSEKFILFFYVKEVPTSNSSTRDEFSIDAERAEIDPIDGPTVHR